MTRTELYARIVTGGGLTDLSPRAKFRLTGADRVRFLNGQVTNDVRTLVAGQSLYACVTTAKGKMSADVFITARPDSFLIDAEPVLRESLEARLDQYIIADDVTLSDVTDELSLLHWVQGSEVRSTFIIDGAPTTSLTPTNRFGRPGIDFWVGQQQEAQFAQDLGGTLLDEEMLEVLRIEAGIPRWGFELTEETIPPEAGLDRTAIDYHKGCYIGQEIISRIKSVGHVNRVLRGFVSASAPLSDGMQLFDGDKPAGRLTSATYSFRLERPVALGYLKRAIDASLLTARTPDGRQTCTVEVKELPLLA